MEILEDYLLYDFNEIFMNNKMYHNGDKLSNNVKYKVGNGLLEVSDLIIYMGKTHDLYSTIFDKELIFSNYESLLRELKGYFYIKPSYAFQVNRIIKKYSSKNGKKLHLMKNNWKWNEDSVYEYIKSGIFSNSPILMTNWNYKNNNKKWNLIVGLRKYENNNIKIVTYSENNIYYLDFHDWLYRDFLYRSLLYYK